MTCLYSFLFLVAVKVSLVRSQVNIPTAPFNADGNVVAAVANSQAHNSGGHITVNNFDIVVPDNLIVQFPSTWIPFQQFAANNFIGDEVMINGNIVNGTAMAAQIIVARNLANIGQGYIESIDFATGSMKISGGPTIRINDPNGVFSVGNTDGKFEYKADDVSPSITSAGGFPMCIPRNSTDPLCPLSQRPAGQQFFTAVDPLVMAPFMPGDYIMFSGVPVGDEMLVYAINSPSVMINCADPVYIRLEDAKGGIFDGDPTDNEFGDFVFTGTMTDQHPTVEVFAQDTDPCTGVVTDRPVGSGFVLSLDEIRNKWEYRADTVAFANYTREYKLRVSSGTKVTKNGIVAGEYVTPITEWVLPELLNVGRDPNPVPFDGFRQLTQGIYQDNYAFGQLKPWPGASPIPPAPACRNASITTSNSTATPTLAPMTAITQIPGSEVTMTAKMTNTDLSFSNTKVKWTQVSGPAVTIDGNDTSSATFLAPSQDSTNVTVLRQFKIEVANSLNARAAGWTIVNVTTDTSVPDIVTIDSYTETHTKGGTIAVVAHSNVIIDSSAQLTLFEGTALAFAMTDLGHGAFSYQARSTKQPPSITVRSAYGGSATLVDTTN